MSQSLSLPLARRSRSRSTSTTVQCFAESASVGPNAAERLRPDGYGWGVESTTRLWTSRLPPSFLFRRVTGRYQISASSRWSTSSRYQATRSRSATLRPRPRGFGHCLLPNRDRSIAFFSRLCAEPHRPRQSSSFAVQGRRAERRPRRHYPPLRALRLEFLVRPLARSAAGSR